MYKCSTVEAALIGFFKSSTANRYLVAYSAGPDSTALLHAAASLREACGIELVACWVDHCLRSETEMAAERQLAESFCQRLAVPLIIKQAEPEQLAIAARQNSSGGMEATARQFRYQQLELARQESHSEQILTAHTADDAEETLIMRFFTGSGSGGLSGIAAVNGKLRRPLLSVRKIELLRYLDAKGLSASLDSTNATDAYLRNRVRRHLVPVLAQVFPAYPAALATSARKHQLESAALDSYARQLIYQQDGQSWIRKTDFFSAPAAVAIRALYLLSLPLAGRVPWQFFERAFFAGKDHAILAEGYGISVYCSGNFIGVKKLTDSMAKAEAMAEFGVVVNAPGQFAIGFGLSIAVSVSDDDNYLRADSCVFPLLVRTRRPGDVIRLRQGTVKLDKLVSGKPGQTPGYSTVLVVEDAFGILAVLSGTKRAKPVYRYNKSLLLCQSQSFLAIELKGVVSSDAI